MVNDTQDPPQSALEAEVPNEALEAEVARLEALLSRKMPKRAPTPKPHPTTVSGAQPLLRRLRNSGTGVRLDLGTWSGDLDATRREIDALGAMTTTWEPLPFEAPEAPRASILLAFPSAPPDGRLASLRTLHEHSRAQGVALYAWAPLPAGGAPDASVYVNTFRPHATGEIQRLRAALASTEAETPVGGIRVDFTAPAERGFGLKSGDGAHAALAVAALTQADAVPRTAGVTDPSLAALIWAAELRQGTQLRIEKELRYDTQARLLAGLRLFGHPVVALIPIDRSA